MAIDNVLVITGGAGGMGLACARALADRGRLLLVDLREDLLDQARKALSAQGAVVETLSCDITSAADVAAVADRVRELGRLRTHHGAHFRPLLAAAPANPVQPTCGRDIVPGNHRLHVPHCERASQ